MKTNDNESDVLILGAGVAGLAAARALCDAGLRVRIIEARHRIGGRVFTLHDPLSDRPVELGAEFIHGKPRSTMDLVEGTNLGFFDVLDEHHKSTSHGPKKVEGFWDKIDDVLKRLNTKGTDRSFAEFLRSELDLSPEERDLATSFVEGFHASDARLLSEQGLAQSEQATGETEGSDDGGASESFRLFEGYDSIPLALFRSLPKAKATLHLNTIVSEIHWRRGRVDVVTDPRGASGPRTFSAARAIVSLPWGVLQAPWPEPGAVRISPEPNTLREARGAIRMGNALRIVLRFRERFWDELTSEPIGYLHGDSRTPIPTWWTPMPLRAPVWVGWAGGPKAEALSMQGEARVLDTALETLGQLLGCGPREPRKHLQTWYYHDWQRDPFSRGAYSYIAVGGVDAASRLSQPVDETLYFAGEALQAGAERGTVSGAITTGYRAAHQVLSALKTPHKAPEAPRLSFDQI